MKKMKEEKIKPLNELEERIINDNDLIKGVEWGKPRNGHPEGKVLFHVLDVLDNVDKYFLNDGDYSKLRLIALTHDSFKYLVDVTKPKSGENHHAMIARRFAEKYINDVDILDIIELHDEAYNSWSVGNRRGDWKSARNRAFKLIERLETKERIDLYLKFYKSDFTDGKSDYDFIWFVDLVGVI